MTKEITPEDMYRLDPPRPRVKLQAGTLRAPTEVWTWYETQAHAMGTSRNKLMWAALVRFMAQETITGVIQATAGWTAHNRAEG